MATRSYIGEVITIKRKKMVRYVYCHSDGYIDWNGRHLYQHYKFPEKVKALIDLGGLSCIRKEIGDGPQLNRPHLAPTCVAYHRDRGEDLVINTCTLKEYKKELIKDHPYTYLYEDEHWYVYALKIKRFLPLTPKNFPEITNTFIL